MQEQEVTRTGSRGWNISERGRGYDEEVGEVGGEILVTVNRAEQLQQYKIGGEDTNRGRLRTKPVIEKLIMIVIQMMMMMDRRNLR